MKKITTYRYILAKKGGRKILRVRTVLSNTKQMNTKKMKHSKNIKNNVMVVLISKRSQKTKQLKVAF